MKVSKSSRVDRVGIQTVGLKFENLGYIFREQPTSDYGIDAQVELIDGDNVTGQLIGLQIKSGASWFKEKSGDGYIFRGDNKHLNYWLEHSLPVLIVLCDIETGNCYWQAITASNVRTTNKAWKINVPVNQKINPGMHVDLKRLVKKLPAHKSFTIVSTDDLSHGAAKRYSLRIILNKEHSQNELIELIKNLTIETANCEYHRSDITRDYWGGNPAHVVWLDIYPSAEDEKNNNPLCQSEWFSECLSEDFYPMSNNGEDIGEGIRVSWNNGYLTNSKFNSQHTISKESFMLQVTSLTEKLSLLISEAECAYRSYESSSIDFDALSIKMKNNFEVVDDIYSMGINLGFSPYECKDLSVKFHSLIAHAHNVYLPFSTIGNKSSESQATYTIQSQIQYYYEALVGFEFESKKAQ